MSAIANVSRRTVLKTSAALGGGLVLGCVLPGRNASGSKGASDKAQGQSLNAFVTIDTNGLVTLTAPRPECGTGVKTSMVMLVAEELGVDWNTVKVVHATADQKFGAQGIGGSGSVRGSFGPLRQAGAAAALMLRQAAAAKWGVDVAQCRVENGSVVSSAGGSGGSQKASFGELVEAASKLPVPDRSALTMKSPADFKLLGKPTKRVDALEIAMGKAIFGIDSRPKGAKVAVIARTPSFGGSLKSCDEEAAKKSPGVTNVIRMGSGVVVVGNDTNSAMRGREALDCKWDAGPNASINSDELSKRFRAAVQPFPDMPAGATAVESWYELPYLSHAPLEPMNCAADVRADSVEVWAPTQQPGGAVQAAAQASGLNQGQVTVHLPCVGGGFGRRLGNDYVSEAVSISKAIGAPVQVLWSRDDDLKHDNYRPATYHAMKGAVDASGNPVAFYHQCIRGDGGRGRGAGGWGGLQSMYSVPGGSLFAGIGAPVPTGAWRSVDATFMGWATESFFDELCAAGKKDPVQARLSLLQSGRLKQCVQLAAEKSNWGRALPAGWGRGIACYDSFGSSVAHVAEVEVKPSGAVRVHRVVSAVGCGFVVNPLGAMAMLQGAMMDGIACLMYAQITIENGGVSESSWAEFGWSRMSDAPAHEIHFLPSQDSPSGLGEPGFPPAGPAVANAIFAACGKRVRKLPINGKVS